MIAIDDQPIDASFFREGKWLSDFVTPDALEVQSLYAEITHGLHDQISKIEACHWWVASQVKYKQNVSGKLTIGGHTSYQNDLWMSPSLVKIVKIGNCANKAFLMASLLRNEFAAEDVHVVLGNLYNGKPGGHAWTQVRVEGIEYISETTRADVPPMILAVVAERYEEVHLFNDVDSYAIEGKTALEPFSACYSTWLRDYLDWTYIEGKK